MGHWIINKEGVCFFDGIAASTSLQIPFKITIKYRENYASIQFFDAPSKISFGRYYRYYLEVEGLVSKDSEDNIINNGRILGNFGKQRYELLIMNINSERYLESFFNFIEKYYGAFDKSQRKEICTALKMDVKVLSELESQRKPTTKKEPVTKSQENKEISVNGNNMGKWVIKEKAAIEGEVGEYVFEGSPSVEGLSAPLGITIKYSERPGKRKARATIAFSEGIAKVECAQLLESYLVEEGLVSPDLSNNGFFGNTDSGSGMGLLIENIRDEGYLAYFFCFIEKYYGAFDESQRKEICTALRMDVKTLEEGICRRKLKTPMLLSGGPGAVPKTKPTEGSALSLPMQSAKATPLQDVGSPTAAKPDRTMR